MTTCPQTCTSPTCVWGSDLACICRHSCSSRRVCTSSPPPTCRWSQWRPEEKRKCVMDTCNRGNIAWRMNLLWQGCRCRARPGNWSSSSMYQVLPSRHQTRSETVCTCSVNTISSHHSGRRGNIRCFWPGDHVVKLRKKLLHDELLRFETILLVQQVEGVKPLVEGVVESKVQWPGSKKCKSFTKQTSTRIVLWQHM